MVFGIEKRDLKFNFLGQKYEIDMEGKSVLSFVTMDEIVYADKGSGERISEINWDSGVMGGFGLNLRLAPEDLFKKKIGLIVETGILWRVPFAGGNVIDTDWDYGGEKYSRGESKGVFINGFEVKTQAGLNFLIGKMFLLNVGAGFWYFRNGVFAVDGTVEQVAPGEPWEMREKFNLYGVNMFYVQEWIVVKPNLGFKMKFEKFILGANFSLSPLIWGYHIDNHFFKKLDLNDDEYEDEDQRYVVYEDTVKGGIYWELGVDAVFALSKYFELNILMNYKNISGSRGDTVIKTTGLVGYMVRDYDAAGGGMDNFEIGCVFRVKL